MQHEFVFAGFGGQGVMFAGQLLTYAAMDQGFNVTWIPSYGPEMRGGTANCFVIISDAAIGSPVVKQPKVGVIFNTPSYTKFAPTIHSDGLLVYNDSMIIHPDKRTDLRVVAVPATELATKVGDVQMTNMIMLAATLVCYPILSIDALKGALEAHLPAHRRSKLAANYEAIARGVEFAQRQGAAVASISHA
ncbi:MAG: 2-oxoacid:acceptor oxidoreductase family protein [Anaerolineae bacterium]|nr:2-oxoacid:acceptor oxidoreductase family protein [Anaerolineae bacterium]